MHPADAVLLALCHRELAPDDSAAVERHTSGCAVCARRLEALRRDDVAVAALLGFLDHRDDARVVVPVAPLRGRAPATGWRHWVAAGLAFFVVSAVAVALPGSPLRRWFLEGKPAAPTVRVVAAPPEPPPPPQPPPEPAAAARVSGVALGPAVDAEVVFAEDQPAGDIRLVLADTGTVRVKALGGRVGFRVGEARIVVDNHLPATRYEVTVPRSLPRLVLRVGARPLIEIRNGRARSSDGALSDVPRTIAMSRDTTRRIP